MEVAELGLSRAAREGGGVPFEQAAVSVARFAAHSEFAFARRRRRERRLARLHLFLQCVELFCFCFWFYWSTAKMLWGAKHIVSRMRMKCNGKIRMNVMGNKINAPSPVGYARTSCSLRVASVGQASSWAAVECEWAGKRRSGVVRRRRAARGGRAGGSAGASHEDRHTCNTLRLCCELSILRRRTHTVPVRNAIGTPSEE